MIYGRAPSQSARLAGTSAEGGAGCAGGRYVDGRGGVAAPSNLHCFNAGRVPVRGANCTRPNGAAC